MTKLAQLIASATVVVSLSAITENAKATHDFMIRLDNSPNGSGCSGASCFADTESDDTVTLHVYFGVCQATPTRTATGVLNTVSGTHDFEFDGIGGCLADPCNITHIWLTTDGGDWLWIDQMEVKAGDGTEVWERGSDNEQGWCVSTDPADGWDAVCGPDDSFYWAPSVKINGNNDESYWVPPSSVPYCD